MKKSIMKLQEASKDAIKQNPFAQGLPLIEEIQKLLIYNADKNKNPIYSSSRYTEGLVQYKK